MRLSDNVMSIPKTIFTPNDKGPKYLSENNNAVLNIINKAIEQKYNHFSNSVIVKPIDFTREVLIKLGIIHQGLINNEALRRYKKYCNDLNQAIRDNKENRFHSDNQKKSDNQIEIKKQDAYYSYLPRYLRYLKDVQKALAKKQAIYNTEKEREDEIKRLEDIKEQQKNKQTANLNNKDTKVKNNDKDK